MAQPIRAPACWRSSSELRCRLVGLNPQKSQLPTGRPSSRNPVDERIGLFVTVDSSRFARLRIARGFLGAWRRFVDSAGDKAEPSSARSVLSPSLLTCLHDFAHVPCRPNLENVAVFHRRMLRHEL